MTEENQKLLSSEQIVSNTEETGTNNEQILLNNEQITEILYKNTPCKGCIYFFFRVFVYVLILVGLGDVLGSILVYTVTKTIDWYNAGYALLGIFIIFLASFSYTTRESTGGTCFYLLMLFLCFLGQLGVTIGIILYTNYTSLIGAVDAEAVRYCMLSTSIVVFLALFVGLLYYCMLAKEQKKRNLYFLLYGEPPDDMQPIVGANLWRKYERTMLRWNRLFR